MRISSWTWALAALLWCGASIAPAQTYTIKFNSRQTIGTTVTVRDTWIERGSLKFFFPDGKLAHEAPPKKQEMIYSVTPLEQETSDGQSGKRKLFYETATETINGKTRKLSYHGRTLILARKDGVYRVGVVGEPRLDPADVDKLLTEANQKHSGINWDRAITPDKSVAVGESWPVDPKAVATMCKEIDLDSKVIRADAKLVRVYTRGSNRFGTLEVSIEATVQSFGVDSKFDPPAIQRMKVTTDRAIDGSAADRTEVADGDLKGKGTVRKGEASFGVEMGMGFSARAEYSVERDDPKAREVPAVEFVGPGGWVEYTSKEGRFTATFPGNPKVSKKDGAGYTTTLIQADRERGNIAYTVSYIDYATVPPDVDPKDFVKVVAASLKDKAEIKVTKEIERSGLTGIESACEYENNGIKMAMTHQVFYTDGRMYQVLVINAIGVTEKVEVRRFLDSLRIDRANNELKGKAADKK